jgi:shikimate dehydrogenase
MSYNLGLIGYPIQASISPLIHSFFLAKYGINGGYNTFPVKEVEEVPILMHFLERFSFTGLNITVPHKQNILSHVAVADDIVSRLGAANTLHWQKDGWHAFNTDVHGFNRLLGHHRITVADKRILIIGAGGAARAAIMALEALGVQEIAIVNRTEHRVEELRAIFSEMTINYFKYEGLNTPLNFDIVINAAPIDWQNKIWLDRFWQGEPFGGNQPAVAIDMQYSEVTPFLEMWTDSLQINGFAMLAAQAAKAFEIWFGIYPEYDLNELKALVYGDK